MSETRGRKKAEFPAEFTGKKVHEVSGTKITLRELLEVTYSSMESGQARAVAPEELKEFRFHMDEMLKRADAISVKVKAGRAEERKPGRAGGRRSART